MKNILVVFTGGTIGSVAEMGTIKTTDAAPFKLITAFQELRSDYRHIAFKTIRPFEMLSENLNPSAWQTLIDAIASEHPDRYDGVIVTHGTDTLAYTAAALSFYFHDLPVPLLLVSSDCPLDNPKANGLENFACAVDFILQMELAGVYVPYRNHRQSCHVHRGTRLMGSFQLSGDFASIQGKSFMRYRDGTFTQLNPVRQTQPSSAVKLLPRFADDILMIKPYPGLNYANFDLARVRAVLHDLYHSGTACATEQWGEEYSLPLFIRRCKKQGVKVYLAPALQRADAYETTRALIEEGAEMIWDMSIEATYVKLLLAYGNFSDESRITAFIENDIAGEHI
ncbi:MAG: asparaginase [Gammaproteobacteria bacterium]